MSSSERTELLHVVRMKREAEGESAAGGGISFIGTTLLLIIMSAFFMTKKKKEERWKKEGLQREKERESLSMYSSKFKQLFPTLLLRVFSP